MKTKASYQVITKKDSRKLPKFLSKDGHLLLPMLELITQAEMAVDELIDVIGRAMVEVVLLMRFTWTGFGSASIMCSAQSAWTAVVTSMCLGWCMAWRKRECHSL